MVSNPMRMKVTECTARTLRQGEAVSELEAQGEDLEYSMAKAEKALKSIGVTIRGETADSLQDIEEIIGDVAGAWDTLSDSERQAVSEAMAGTNRSSMFSALIENYDRVITLQKEALSSDGDLLEANQKRVESLAGQWNILKDKMMALSDGMQPMLFTLVDIGNGALDLANNLGTLPTVIGLSTNAFLLLNKSGREFTESMTNAIPVIGKLNTSIQSEIVELNKLIDKKRASALALQEKIDKMKSAGVASAYYQGQLRKTQTTLALAQAKTIALTVATQALQMAMSMGLSLAISGVISLLGKLWSSFTNGTDILDNINEKFNELNNSYNELNADTSKLDKMVEQYGNLERKLSSTKKGSEEYKSAEEELLSIQKELATLYPELVSYVDSEGVAYANNKESIESYVELKKEELEAEKELLKLQAQANTTTLEDSLASLKEEAKDLQEQIAKNNEEISEFNKKRAEGNNGFFYQLDSQIASEQQQKLIDKLTEVNQKIKETEATLKSYQDVLNESVVEDEQDNSETDSLAESLERLKDNANFIGSASDIASDSLSNLQATLESLKETNSQDTFNQLIEDLKLIGDDGEVAQSALDSLKGMFSEMGDEVDTLSEAIEYLGTKAILETSQSAEELHQILADLKKEGAKALDTSTMQTLLEMYPELGSRVGDVAYIQEFLNEKIDEMRQVTEDTYDSMLARDSEFWNSKIKNSEEWMKHEEEVQSRVAQLGAEMLGIQEEDFVNFINAKGGFREVDLTNAKNATEAEGTLNTNLLNQLASLYSQYFNEKGGARSQDLKNVEDFLNSQGVAEATTIQQLVKLWNDYYKAKKAEILDSINKMAGDYGDLGNVDPGLMKQLNALENSAKTMGNYFETISTSFQGVTTSLGSATDFANRFNSALNGTSIKDKTSSSSKKEVADLELKIDRYYALQDAIDDVTNALAENRREQEKAEGKQRLVKLFEEELKLIEKQKKAYEDLLKEQKNQAQDYRNAIANAGFTMDGEGNITNYQKQLQAMVNYANSLSGDAKKAQIEYVKGISDIIDAYTTLTNSTIPKTEESIDNLASDIKNLNKEHEEAIKYLNDLKDAFYNLNKEIKDIDNALDLNRAKQENATPQERVKLMEEEIALMKERQKLIKEQEDAYNKSAKDIAEQLSAQGIKFKADGSIANYDEVIDNLINLANNLVGTSQEEAQKEIEDLLDLIEEYDNIMMDTLPELATKWEEYTTAIKEAEKAKAELITSVEKDITSAIENEYNKRYNAQKKALQKEKDLYNEQYEQEDYENNLATKQRELDELQKAIDDMARDTSDAGQMKLKDLLEQYKQKQEEINEFIREQEKQQGNDRFDEEMEKLEEELEEALNAENLANMVNKALVDGFVTIGDEVIELNTLMSDWLDETGDGLYAIGDILKEELINNLKTAQELMAGMGLLTTTPSTSSFSLNNDEAMKSALEKLGVKPTENNVSIGTLLTVEGNVVEETLPDIQEMLDNAIDRLAIEMSKY